MQAGEVTVSKRRNIDKNDIDKQSIDTLFIETSRKGLIFLWGYYIIAVAFPKQSMANIHITSRRQTYA